MAGHCHVDHFGQKHGVVIFMVDVADIVIKL